MQTERVRGEFTSRTYQTITKLIDFLSFSIFIGHKELLKQCGNSRTWTFVKTTLDAGNFFD